MVDSKAASGPSDNSSHRKVTEVLFDMAQAAFGRAKSRKIDDRLLGDDVFLERLAEKVANKLHTRQHRIGDEATSPLGPAAKAFEQIADRARNQPG